MEESINQLPSEPAVENPNSTTINFRSSDGSKNFN